MRASRGNARIAGEFLKRIAEAVPQKNLRTKTMATSVQIKGDRVEVQCRTQDNHAYTIRAKAVVMAGSKQIARHIVQDLPKEQSDAMNRLTYSAYLVGNVLLNKPVSDKFFDLFLLGSATPGPEQDSATDARRAKVVDVVLGAFAQHGDASRSVLTLYWPLPYGSVSSYMIARPPDLPGTGFEGLLAPAWKKWRAVLDPVVKKILPIVGLTADAIYDIRTTTWGHPYVDASKGLIADSTVLKAPSPVDGKIFFCNQDNWALPSIETCLYCAIETETRVRTRLS